MNFNHSNSSQASVASNASVGADFYGSNHNHNTNHSSDLSWIHSERENSRSLHGSSQSNHQPSSPLSRKRGESIDMFLSKSPSQTLGPEFLRFRQDVDLDAIPPVNLVDGYNDNSKSLSSSSYHSDSFGNSAAPAPPPGLNTDIHGKLISPTTSVTGTTSSSRSVSPSWNNANNDGSMRRGGVLPSVASYHSSDGNYNGIPLKQGQNQFSAMNSRPAEVGRSPRMIPSHPYFLPDDNSNGGHHSNNNSMVGLNNNSFHNTSNYHPSYPNTDNDSIHNYNQRGVPQFQGAGVHGFKDQQQPVFPDSNGPTQQVFYMAVRTQDGQGQILQPVQMVQIPGQPNAFVLPAGMTNQNIMSFSNNMNHQNSSQSLMSQGMVVQPSQNLGGIGDIYHNDNHKKKNGRNPYKNPSSLNQRVNGTPTSSIGKHYSNNDLMKVGVNRNAHIRSNSAPMNYNESGLEDSLHMPNDYSNMYNDQRDILAPRQAPNDDFVASLYASPQRPPLSDLLGHVRRLSRDQVGCRLLQQSLDEEGAKAATLILNEGLSFWGEAMVDPFGNYLFQKILEKITPEERVILVKNVASRLVNASLNLHGTRSVQKVVEMCASDEDIMVKMLYEKDPTNAGSHDTSAKIMTAALTPAAARLCIDSHGNHVIQRILLKLPYHYSNFVFDAVASSVGDVARHRHGCCVIQRCLDSSPSAARSNLVRRIIEKSLELMQDAYGNYVVQYVLDVCSDEDVHAVCESVVGKVNLLAIQKFSSNVLEKCLERCNDKTRQAYLEELSDQERIRELMMDPFGNYVIQRALAVATHGQAIQLVEAMKPHLIANSSGGSSIKGGIRNTAGGRRIMAKINRRFPNFDWGIGVVEDINIPHDPYNRQVGNHEYLSYGGGGGGGMSHYQPM
jgi:hypothetical protein